ncbi:MAG: phosphatase PAP2 family protein, partial [Bacteroidota bacterium]
WIPAYLLAAFLLIKKYQWQGVRLLLLIGLGILIADQLTSSVIKPWVGRPRPCHAPAFVGQIRELVGCGGHDSFPSSHASNHFALAMILSLTWLKKSRAWQWILFLWAISISLAQVYVAKHYPVDILVGALIGLLVASGLVFLYKKGADDIWQVN